MNYTYVLEYTDLHTVVNDHKQNRHIGLRPARSLMFNGRLQTVVFTPNLNPHYVLVKLVATPMRVRILSSLFNLFYKFGYVDSVDHYYRVHLSVIM